MKAQFLLNGTPVQWSGSQETRLLTVLRDSCGVTDPKPGCEIGRCGACLVLLNGEAVPSCLVLGARLEGAEVLTTAGLGEDGARILDALARHGAIQCGYCTAGLVVALAGAMRRAPKPASAEVLAEIDGQICRCGGYAGVRRAVGALFD